MPRRMGLWIACLAAGLGCGDSAGTAEHDAGREPPGNYGRDGGGNCGDGILDRGEDCDGTVIGQSCESLGMVRGPLSCTPQCTIDTSLCGTNPRPDPPFIPDGGTFFDSGLGRPFEAVQQACDQIVSCGTVPLPTTDELFAFGFSPNQQDFCTQQLTDSCLDCTLGEIRPDPDSDAGAVACESHCREACWDLSFSHADGLFAPDRCVTTAADFVSRFDAACLCDACQGPLHDCLQDSFCYAALVCIDETGCQGSACSNSGACGDPITTAAIVGLSSQLDDLRACIADNGCQEP